MRIWFLVGFLALATASFFATKAERQSEVSKADGGNPPPPWP
jgi:hypothetical protein